MRGLGRTIGAVLGVLASSAAAQNTFAPPEGCTGVLTVQHRACLVTHVWQCEADAPGDQWVALFTQFGPFSIKKVDADFQWLETYYGFPPSVETMEADPADPASLEELFATDVDTYDFVTTSDDGTPPERIVGFDRLTGQTMIDDEPLFTTEFAYQVRNPDGTVESDGAGAQFVSERHRMFFLGRSWSAEDPEQVFDASPLEFIYPGEPGFFASSPVHECQTTTTGFVE